MPEHMVRPPQLVASFTYQQPSDSVNTTKRAQEQEGGGGIRTQKGIDFVISPLSMNFIGAHQVIKIHMVSLRIQFFPVKDVIYKYFLIFFTEQFSIHILDLKEAVTL